jgi:hypothetical protein
MRTAARLLLGLTVMIAGCAASVGELRLASTRPLKLPRHTVLRRGVSGTDCSHKVVGIPLKGGPDLNAAVTKALAQVPGGTLLTDVAVDNDYLITVLYNRSCLRVTGTVVGE